MRAKKTLTPFVSRPLHPLLIRCLIRLLAREYRLSWFVFREEKEKWRNPDPLRIEEVPLTGTMCGWMRNEREAQAYDSWLKYH